MKSDEKRLLIEILERLSATVGQVDSRLDDNGDDSTIMRDVDDKIRALNRSFAA